MGKNVKLRTIEKKELLPFIQNAPHQNESVRPHNLTPSALEYKFPADIFRIPPQLFPERAAKWGESPHSS